MALENPRAPRGGAEHATVIDLSLAGAGLESERALVPGELVSLTFATPTMWDPLVISAVVRWSAPTSPASASRAHMRAGVAFDYPGEDLVLSMFAMLATLDYE